MTAGGTIYVGSGDGSLYAIEREQGAREWAFETGGSIIAAPAVINGTVYVGSTDGTLYALDAATGDEQWSFTSQGPIEAAPTVHEGTVYIGSDDKRLYAIDAATGREAWAVETDSLVTSTPAVVNDTVYFGSADDHIYAVNVSGGDRQWTVKTGNGVNSSPAVVDGTVYISSNDGYLYALAKRNGEQKWTFPLGGLGGTSPAVSGDRVFVSEGATGHRIHCLKTSTGERLWTGKTGDSVRSSIAVADGVAYFGSSDNTIYAVETTNGDLLWRFRTNGPVTSSPAVVENTVYIGSTDGRLYALTGDGERTANIPASPAATPTTVASSSPTTSTNDSGASGGSFPILPALLTAAGVGGGGALWLHSRRSQTTTDTATPDPGSGPSDPTTDSMAPTLPDSAGETTLTVTSWLGDADRREPTEIPTTPSFDLSFTDITEQEQISESERAELTKAIATTPQGDIPLAVQKPRFTGTIQTEAIEQWQTAAETWSKLDGHDHIVDVVAYDSEPLPWLAMEFMDSGSLTERMAEMPPLQKLWTAIAITNGIYHAHRRGVAHLGVTPESISFQSSGDEWPIPKVSTWGFDSTSTGAGPDAGGFVRDSAAITPYTAPEQLDGSLGASDNVTDVYRVGAVLYELFTGHPPVDADGTPTDLREAILDVEPTPPSERADVPSELDDILLPALAASKDERYDSIVYLRNALEDLYRE